MRTDKVAAFTNLEVLAALYGMYPSRFPDPFEGAFCRYEVAGDILLVKMMEVK